MAGTRFNRLGALFLGLTILIPSVASAEPLVLVVTQAAVGWVGVGQPVIRLHLAPESADALKELTLKNVGSKVDLRVDGEVVMSPVIRDPIVSGSLEISGMPDGVDLAALAKRIADGKVRVEIEVVGD
jgi:preprotein translocase subunit SecD